MLSRFRCCICTYCFNVKGVIFGLGLTVTLKHWRNKPVNIAVVAELHYLRHRMKCIKWCLLFSEKCALRVFNSDHNIVASVHTLDMGNNYTWFELVFYSWSDIHDLKGDRHFYTSTARANKSNYIKLIHCCEIKLPQEGSHFFAICKTLICYTLWCLYSTLDTTRYYM